MKRRSSRWKFRGFFMLMDYAVLCSMFLLGCLFVGMFVDYFMALKDEYDCWIYYFMNIINIIKYKN